MISVWHKKIHLALVISLSVTALACAPDKGNHPEDPVLTAYQLIDEHRSEEAVTYLEDKLKAKPGDYDLQMTLASAYAHLGGVKIQKFIPLIKQLMQMQELMKQKDKDEKKHPKTETPDESRSSGEPVEVRVGEEAVQITADDVALGLNQFGVFIGLYASIPDVRPEKAIYVDHAIKIVSDLGEKLKTSDKVFRVVLNIIRLKTFISKNLVDEAFSVLKSKPSDVRNCSLNEATAYKQGLHGMKILRSILSDVLEIRPEKKEQLTPLVSNVDRSMRALTEASGSVKVMSDEEQQHLTNTVVQNGFGKILKCDGESAAP